MRILLAVLMPLLLVFFGYVLFKRRRWFWGLLAIAGGFYWLIGGAMIDASQH